MEKLAWKIARETEYRENSNIEARGVKGRMENFLVKFINVRFVMSDRVGILLRNRIEINLRDKG